MSLQLNEKMLNLRILRFNFSCLLLNRIFCLS